MKRKFTKWHKKGLGAVFAFAVTLCTGLLDCSKVVGNGYENISGFRYGL